MRQYNEFGVPMEPATHTKRLMAFDYLNRPIFDDDDHDYILIDGDYVPDTPDEIRSWLLQEGVVYEPHEVNV